MVLKKDQMVFWKENGFLVLKNFMTKNTMNYINSYLDDRWTSPEKEKSEIVIDIFIGTPQERRVAIKDASLNARRLPHKINDIYLESKKIREIILNNKLSQILNQLLSGRPIIINTLSLEFGSQQGYHTDSLFMTPPKDLNLIATWLALEDVEPFAGPLKYFPGSHKIKPFLFSSGKMTVIPDEMENYESYMNQQLEKKKLTEEIFIAETGDLFIWHSQLYHGGSNIKKRKLTRRSLITHYFKEGDFEGDIQPVNEYGLFLNRNRQPVKTKQL